MSETPEPPYTRRYCAPGDGVEGGYIIGCDPAIHGFDPVVFVRMQQQMTSEMQQLMGIPVEHVNLDHQPRTLKMDDFIAFAKAMRKIDEEEMASYRASAKQAVDAAVAKHGIRALFVRLPRLEGSNLVDKAIGTRMEKAINDELETRRKLLFQKAAETTNEKDNE